MRRKSDQERWQARLKAENERLKEDLVNARMAAGMEADEVERQEKLVDKLEAENEACDAVMDALSEELDRVKKWHRDEVLRHAACLSIAEGRPDWDKPMKDESPAMVAVRNLRREFEAKSAALALANEMLKVLEPEVETRTTTGEPEISRIRVDPVAIVTIKDGKIVAVEPGDDMSLREVDDAPPDTSDSAEQEESKP